jgi:hypothetical protein
VAFRHPLSAPQSTLHQNKREERTAGQKLGSRQLIVAIEWCPKGTGARLEKGPTANGAALKNHMGKGLSPNMDQIKH